MVFCSLQPRAFTHTHTHTNTHTHRKDTSTSKMHYRLIVHIQDGGNHGHMQENDDQRLIVDVALHNRRAPFASADSTCNCRGGKCCMCHLRIATCTPGKSCTHTHTSLMNCKNIRHVSPRVGTCAAHAELGKGKGNCVITKHPLDEATRKKAPGPSWCRPLSRGARVGLFGPR